MSTLTDTQRLDWLLTAAFGDETGGPDADASEAMTAGWNLGLRGRELIDSAMNAVRFDEVGVEKSTEIVQAMIHERTANELIEAIAFEVRAGHPLLIAHDGGETFEASFTNAGSRYEGRDLHATLTALVATRPSETAQ